MNHRIFNAVYCSAWNILGTAWESIHAALMARKDTPINAEELGFFGERPKMTIDQNGIANIYVDGILGNLTPMEKECGGTDYGDLAAEFGKAGAEASGIMLQVSSPGGQSAGNIETAEVFADFRGPKSAFISGLGASAGYAVAASADRITAEPSALVGSIGSILPYVDKSEAWEKAGIKADYIQSGDLKAAGAPPSLNDDERAHLQQIVLDYADQFKSHVTRFRAVPESAMQGGAYVGPRAQSLNLIDATGTFSEAYTELLARIS